MTLVLATLLLCAPQGGKLPWSKDYEASLKEAKKSGKFVVVHFSGPG
ncbi:MAG: hypothetical protein HY293_15955 [Planctomycetes bacterium]|nr:hypothetical protein [Planctomycetota bacterium]